MILVLTIYWNKNDIAHLHSCVFKARTPPSPQSRTPRAETSQALPSGFTDETDEDVTSPRSHSEKRGA